MTEPLPSFPYHPDPISTGSVAESDVRCLACGQARGFIYRGPVYSSHPEELSDALCPWCPADGTAAVRFDAHPDALEMLRHEVDEYGWPAAEVEEFLEGLEKDGDHTAYLFVCRHCGAHLAYSDSA